MIEQLSMLKAFLVGGVNKRYVFEISGRRPRQLTKKTTPNIHTHNI